MSERDPVVEQESIPIAPRWMEPALENFAELAAQHRLGHAYLLISDDPLQAALFAQCIALRKLCQQNAETPCGTCLGCRSFAQRAHGDLLEVRAEPGKFAIGIEQIRAASRFFQQTALYGDIKILIIEKAESMTPAAANSLLKTLEEPSGNSLILLAVSEVWRLPPTIRSRCQLINLPLPSQEEALAWLVDDCHWERGQAQVALSVHHGRAVTASDAAAETTDQLEALFESFNGITTAANAQSAVPGVWADVETPVLVYQLISWCEYKAHATDFVGGRTEGQRWLLLHSCLTALWGRLRGGATPAKDILSNELYRLCRTAQHPQFPSIAEQFLAGLGKYGVAG